jgi:hypothetical protein
MSRATDDSVNVETPKSEISISVTARSTLLGTTAVPDNQTASDLNSVELGVKFSASTAGTITGLRIWKDSLNIGSHTASLWSSTGQKLASTTFANETASGWQEVLFPNPVQIAAGTTYIASYHTNKGEYSEDDNYFVNSYTNGPLTAPSSSSSGGNGIYYYSSSNHFPNNTYNAANYWVDVVFNGQ